MFRIRKVAREHVDRGPAARAHDGGGIKAAPQEILRSPHAHRVPREIARLARIEAGPVRAFLDQSLHRVGRERPIDRLAVIDGTE